MELQLARHCFIHQISHLIQQVILYYVTFLVALVRLTFTILHLGNVYIADTSNNRIRKVTVSTGIISTIAGTGTFSYSGDNGQATSATLNRPFGVALDSSGNSLLSNSSFLRGFTSSFHTSYLGNIYIADYANHRIRKVTVSTEIITTIAGTGASSYSGDNGPATSATLYYPAGVALDSVGSHSSFENYVFICFNLLSFR